MYNIEEPLEQQIINHFNIEEYELKALDALVWDLYHGPIYFVSEENSVFNDLEFEYEGKKYYFGDWSTEGCDGHAFGLLTTIVGKLVDSLHDIYVTDDKDWLIEKAPEGEWDYEYIRENLEELIAKYDCDPDIIAEEIVEEFDNEDCNHYWREPEEYYVYDEHDILSEFINDRAAREILRTL